MSIISVNTNVNQTTFNGYTSPITINAGVTVALDGNITDAVGKYFIIGGSNVVFDGSSNTITVSNIVNYTGLINCATTAYTATIQKLSVSSSGTTTIITGGGWVVQGYTSNTGLDANITCTNCNSTGDMSTSNSGGIFGRFSSGTANYCYSIGGMSATNTGGIFGASSSGKANYCYSTGAITAAGTGGIFGLNSSTSPTSYGTSNYCYSSGNVVSSTSGGIFSGSGVANYCYYTTGTISGGGICGGAILNSSFANYCYSTGAINGGGIFRGSGTATNCYSTGAIGINAGGIFGGTATGVTARFCYSTGAIVGGSNGGGGIFSPNSIGNSINYCYSTGAIGTASNISGGIMAGGVGVTGNTINYCYSTGTSSNATSGGIIMSNATGINSINNCYSSGTTLMANTGTVLTNCIASSSGVWVDTSANATIGAVVPTNWGYTAVSSPWLLSSFNQALYDPSFATFSVSVDSYTTSSGLFTSTTVYSGSPISPNYTLLSVTIPKYTPTINTTTGVLTFTHPEGSIVCNLFCYYTYNSNYVGYSFSAFTLTAPIPCFLIDTKIKVSPTEYTLIQDLKEGDLVYTSDEREVPILKTNQYSIISNPLSSPYIIPKGFRYGEFVCHQDLYLSPEHAVLIDSDKFVPVKALGFQQDTTLTHLTYFHLTFPNFFTDHIVANGVPCESYAGDSALQSNGNYISMYFNHEIFKKVYDKQHFIRKNLTFEKYNRIVESTTINLPIQMKALPTYEVIPAGVDFNFIEEI